MTFFSHGFGWAKKLELVFFFTFLTQITSMFMKDMRETRVDMQSHDFLRGCTCTIVMGLIKVGGSYHDTLVFAWQEGLFGCHGKSMDYAHGSGLS